MCVAMLDDLRHHKAVLFMQFVNLQQRAVAIRVKPALAVMPGWSKTLDLNRTLNFMDVLPYVKFEQGRFQVPITSRLHAIAPMHFQAHACGQVILSDQTTGEELGTMVVAINAHGLPSVLGDNPRLRQPVCTLEGDIRRDWELPFTLNSGRM